MAGMTQGADDDASKPGAVDSGWDDLLGDVATAPVAPAVPAIGGPAKLDPPTFAPPTPDDASSGSEPDDQAPAADGPSSTESVAEPPRPVTAEVSPVDRAPTTESTRTETVDERDGAAGPEAETEPPDEASEPEADAETEEPEATAAAEANANPEEASTANAESRDEAADAEAGAESEPPDTKPAEPAAAVAAKAERAPPSEAADTELEPRVVESAERPDPADPASVPAPAGAEPEEGSGWPWIVGLAAIAVVGFFIFRSGATAHEAGRTEADHHEPAPKEAAEPGHAGDPDPSPHREKPPAPPSAETSGPAPDSHDAPPEPHDDAGGEPIPTTAETGGAEEVESADAGDEAGETGAEAPAAADADPRAVPPGTTEDNARAFEKIPVALSDQPPLVGVGANGIHVDEFDLGEEYEARRCRGVKTAFSVSGGQRANACFRVVHQREEEQVVVHWMKDGELVRRNKVKVPTAHAYKTRASLALREEYVGNWTVQVVSSDDVVLAKGSFTVVE